MSDSLKRFQLVKYVVGDLAHDEREALERHLEGCKGCESSLDEMRGLMAEYQERADEHLSSLMSRLPSKQPEKTQRLWLGGIGLAAALAAAVLVILLWPSGDPGDISYKGDFTVKVVAQKAKEQIFVRESERLSPGDALRFVLTTDEAGYLTVFSVDARGRINPFYPESDPASQPDPMHIDRPGERELPGSIILDDWIGKEYLFVVFSSRSFDRREVHQAARNSVIGGGAQVIEPFELGIEASVEVLPILKVEGLER